MPIGDDVDLDALMLRVRDAARASGGGTVQTQDVRDDMARELDLIRVLEAQDDWNEHARQALMALADGIRTLRDDWAEMEAGLRREIAQLSAQVAQLRARPPRAAAPTRRGSKSRPVPKRRARR